jgi:hypothetical protein
MIVHIPVGQSDWRTESNSVRPGRQLRSLVPDGPKHASAAIFGIGMSGASWAAVVEMLKLWRFRTSNCRHWNEANVLQFWQSHAIPAMKL